MLSFISKRKPKSQKPWKKPIRLVSEPEDYSQSFSQRSIEILDIVDLEKTSPYREPIPLDPSESQKVDLDVKAPRRSSEGDANVIAQSTHHTSPRVEATISQDPMDDWFPRHLLDSDSGDHSELMLTKREQRGSRILLDNDVRNRGLQVLCAFLELTAIFLPLCTVLRTSKSSAST